MYIYICFDGFSHVSPCFPKAAIPSAKPGAFREATHGRRKMSELSEETAEELGSKVWISMKPDNEHWNFKVDIHWYSIYIHWKFNGNRMEISMNILDRTMIFIDIQTLEQIYIYKYPMNMNEYLWNSGYWWWNLIHNSCIRIFDWWLIGLWSLGSLFLSNPWYSQKMGASMGPHYHQ